MIEAERSGPQGVSDVCYAVASYDVESKPSCSRHDAWINDYWSIDSLNETN